MRNEDAPLPLGKGTFSLPSGSVKGDFSMHGQNSGRVSWKAMLALAAAFVLAATAGCAGGVGLPEGDTGTVSGRMTYGDKAVPAGSQVVFVNDKYGIVATGTVSAGGAYSLQMRGGPDILAGAYKISVSPPASGQPEMSQEEYDKMMASGGEVKPSKPKEVPEIPEKVRTPETSGLTYEVKPGKNTGVNFDLKDAKDTKEATESKDSKE